MKKTKETLFGANGKKISIEYKLSNAHICNQDICIKQTFILVKDLKEKALIGVLFLSSIYPMWLDYQGIRTKLLDKEILFEFVNPPDDRSIYTLRDQMIQAKESHNNLLNQEINLVDIEKQLKPQGAIEKFKEKIVGEVCSNISNTFWHKKQHEVEMPYELDFSKKNIPTKARPIQITKDLLSYCDKEIQDLLNKKLIRKSKFPWNCSAFYAQKQVKLETRAPRLVINYKLLNDALRWIRYHIPNKITFLVPLGHYEWNIMPQLSIFIIVEVLIIKTVKSNVKAIPSLAIDDLEPFKIVRIGTLDIGILEQSNDNHEILVRRTTQHIHSIIKKETLSIILCIPKLQKGLLNQEFLLKVDYKSAKSVYKMMLRI